MWSPRFFEFSLRELLWTVKENLGTDYMRVDSIRERALAAERGEWLR